MYPKFTDLSETAIAIEWGNSMDENIHQQVSGLDHLLHQKPFPGFIETVPAYTTLTIYYQLETIAAEHASPFLFIKNYVEKLMGEESGDTAPEKNVVSIPVCYDDAFGYDLEYVANANEILKETVITLHQQTSYKVYMMGFLPGFAYMGAVNMAIATPRKPTPRAKVEEGSVGIAGKQTGIYPLPSPGGWQIIGRTPLCLFDPKKTGPFLLKSGDTVKFYAITKEEFYTIKNAKNDISVTRQDENTADAVVIKPGVLSTVQDNGRFGFRSYGVPPAGAMDSVSHHIANALAGNAKNAATIECAMGGLVLQFRRDSAIALTGGGVANLNNKKIDFYSEVLFSKMMFWKFDLTITAIRN